MTPRGATSWPEQGSTFNQKGRAASSGSPWSMTAARRRWKTIARPQARPRIDASDGRLIEHHTGRDARRPGAEETIMAKALSDRERALMDAYWRAANYLSVGQIYLYDKIHGSRRYTKRA